MKKFIVAAAFLVSMSGAANADLVIKGVVDGPLALDGNGGDPKALVFEALADIPDLSIYGVGTANNGGGSDGQEFTFSGTATLGDLLIVTGDTTHTAYLTSNFASIGPTFENAVAFINGDDPFELFQNGGVIDTYGDVALDGTGEAWEYLDTFAVRTGGTAGAFDINNYNIAALNSLDGLDEAGTANALVPLFGPVTAIPEPTSFALLGFGLVGLVSARRRRRSS